MNSLRFEELNKKCKKIKTKQILKILIPLILILIVFASAVLFYLKIDHKSKISKKTITSKIKNVSIVKKVKRDKNSTVLKSIVKNSKQKPLKKRDKIVSKIKKTDKNKEDKIVLNPALEIPDINTSKIIKNRVKTSLVKNELGDIFPYYEKLKKVRTFSHFQARLPYFTEIK